MNFFLHGEGYEQFAIREGLWTVYVFFYVLWWGLFTELLGHTLENIEWKNMFGQYMTIYLKFLLLYCKVQ